MTYVHVFNSYTEFIFDWTVRNVDPVMNMWLIYFNSYSVINQTRYCDESVTYVFWFKNGDWSLSKQCDIWYNVESLTSVFQFISEMMSQWWICACCILIQIRWLIQAESYESKKTDIFYFIFGDWSWLNFVQLRYSKESMAYVF